MKNSGIHLMLAVVYVIKFSKSKISLFKIIQGSTRFCYCYLVIVISLTLNKSDRVKSIRFHLTFFQFLVFFCFSDELGYLVDAIVNEDKIGSFDKRPNDLSIEVIVVFEMSLLI
jgi:hypothetical protein